MEQILDHTSWVTFYPSKDIKGVWVAHCLDLDIVTQGEGFVGARDSLLEAVGMVLTDDLANGLDPLDRESAPDECWAPLWKLMKDSSKVPLASVPQSKWNELSFIAAQMNIQAHKPDDVKETIVPDAWMIAAEHGFQYQHR